MSLAHKCDRCGALYEPAAGQISIEALYIASDELTESGDRLDNSWSEIDFCGRCSVDVRAAIGAAIDE